MRKAFLETVEYRGERALSLRSHQEEAVRRFKGESEIALFFEMGCGKSLTLLRIAEAKFLGGEIDGLLVIAPNDVHRQWHDELVHGAGEERLRELRVSFQSQCFGGRGGAGELLPFDESQARAEPGWEAAGECHAPAFRRNRYFWFLSVNVDTFSTPSKWKPVVEWANSHRIMIAVDEATTIKNPQSKRSRRILYEFNRTVRRRGRVASTEKIWPWRAVLTGTPVTNGPCDMWAVMEFLRPGYFGMNYWAFRDYFAMFTQAHLGGGGPDRTVPVMLSERAWNGIKGCSMYLEARMRFGISEDTWNTVRKQAEFSGPYKHADELKELIAPVSAFRLLEECEDMPERSYIARRVGMSREQQGVYSKFCKEMAAEYKGARADAANILVMYLRLQQISSGFMVNSDAGEPLCWDESVDYEPGEVVWIGDSVPKMDALLRDIEECAKPVLVLARYTAEAARIWELCRERYRTGLFTGWRVDGGVDALKAGELDVLVANSQKIARGFNLQMSRVTLFYSNSFSMETRQQAEYRTFRMGQRKPCLYVDYIASPVERKIMESLRMKKGLLDYIRGEDSGELLSFLNENWDE